MVFGKKVGFVDLSMLRTGVFKGFYQEGNTWAVRYQPPNSMKEKVIHDIYKDSLHKVESFENPKDCPYAYFMVLVAGEKGRAPFIENYMKEGGMITQLIRKMQSLSEQSSISRAALNTKQRELSRGTGAALKEVTEHMKVVDDATKKEGGYPFGSRLRRPQVY
jgi:hypothetical protein